MRTPIQLVAISLAVLAAASAAFAATGLPNVNLVAFDGLWSLQTNNYFWQNNANWGLDSWGREAPRERPPDYELPRVDIKGKRNNAELITVINNGAAPIEYSRNSADSGFTFPDQELTPPITPDRGKCIAGCGQIQSSENALCDTRTLELTQVVNATAGSVAIYQRWGKYLPVKVPGPVKLWLMTTSPGAVYKDGAVAVAAYLSTCRGLAASRYLDCVEGTCNKP